MRNHQYAEFIADCNKKRARLANFVTTRTGRARRLRLTRCEHERRQMAIANIGPRRPIGSVIYPQAVVDWGLMKLRDACYARLRAKKWGA